MEAVGLNPAGRTPLCAECTFPLCLRGFPPGISASSLITKSWLLGILKKNKHGVVGLCVECHRPQDTTPPSPQVSRGKVQ